MLLHSAFLVVKKTTDHLHSHSLLVHASFHPYIPTPQFHHPTRRGSTPPLLMCAFTTRRTQNIYEHTIIDGGKKTLMRRNLVYQDKTSKSLCFVSTIKSQPQLLQVGENSLMFSNQFALSQIPRPFPFPRLVCSS